MRPFFQTFHTPSAVAKFRGLKSIAVVLCIGACSLTHAAIIEFSGQLDVILIDYGGAIYSDVQTGTFFSGSIDDATFDGDISDGTTLTPFTERGGGMWTENDQIMDADTATLINSLAGTSFVAGDLYDEIEMGGAASTSGEGYIEISLIFILDPLAFNNNPVDYYPPNPDDIVLVIFLIEELVGQEEVIYLALGAVDADSDGVGDHDDFCSNTAIPESVPALGQLKPNHWALTAAGNGFDFDTVLKGKGKGPGRSYTIADTAGCSCEQIIEAQGKGHSNDGCSKGVMDKWVKLVTPMAVQADYDFQLINHPGTTYTQVFGVNDRGDVVGNGFSNDGMGSFPFVYASKEGTFTDVANVAGYVDAAVLGNTDAGVMVGSVESLDEPTERGLIRSKNGTSTVFSDPHGATFTQARGVNNKGLVSGYRDTPAGGGGTNGPTVGFIYDPKTKTFTDIDTAPSVFTIAHGINSKGDVVGSSWFFDEEAPCPVSQDGWVRYAWLRAADGSISYFDVNGSNDMAARGINDAGWIVGWVYDDNDGKFKGFKVKPDGSPCQSLTVADSDLLEFPGFDSTAPEGISNSGDIVGIVEDLNGENQHGFIATPR